MVYETQPKFSFLENIQLQLRTHISYLLVYSYMVIEVEVFPSKKTVQNCKQKRN